MTSGMGPSNCLPVTFLQGGMGGMGMGGIEGMGGVGGMGKWGHWGYGVHGSGGGGERGERGGWEGKGGWQGQGKKKETWPTTALPHYLPCPTSAPPCWLMRRPLQPSCRTCCPTRRPFAARPSTLGPARPPLAACPSTLGPTRLPIDPRPCACAFCGPPINPRPRAPVPCSPPFDPTACEPPLQPRAPPLAARLPPLLPYSQPLAALSRPLQPRALPLVTRPPPLGPPAAPRLANRPSCSLCAATCSPLAAPCCCLPCSLRCPAPARPACCAAMASLRVLAFDHEGRPIQFDTWLDNLQLYLLSDSRDGVSLFDHTSGAAPAPPATTDSATRSQWLTRDAAARLAIRNHLPTGRMRSLRTAQDCTSTVRRLENLVSHLRTSGARYRAALPAEFLDRNPPPMYTTLYLIVTRLPDSLRAGCSPSPLAPSYASTAAVDVLGDEDVEAASATGKRRSSKGKGSRGGGSGNGVVVGATVEVVEVVGVVAGVGALVAAVVAAVGVAVVTAVGVVLNGLELLRGEVLAVARRSSSSIGARPRRPKFGDEANRPRWAKLLRSGVTIFDLDYDAILAAMYALSVSAEGGCYVCVPPDPGIEAAALGASESSLPSTVPAEALHTFMLDSGASHYFFCDSTTLTLLSAPVPVRLGDHSGGPVVARSSTVLPCPAVPSGPLSGLHLPSFSTNLVSTAAFQDAMVTTTTPGGQRMSICTCTRTGRHLATFTRRPASSLYTLATEPPQVVTSAQVSAAGQVAPPCSCRLLSHQTLLWHHHLGHPSLPHLRGMHSSLLVSGLPRSLPPLLPSPAPPCLPCVEGRQRAAPHSSSFPPTSAPLQTLHMDVWGPARVSGQGRERYFLLVVDDYTRYMTVFPLRRVRTFLSCVCTLTKVQNGIAERRIGLVMEVAHTSMIHAAAPHFLWPFEVQYATHQLNLWPHVSLPETSPTLGLTGEAGYASVFRDITFDESVAFYRLFPYRSAPPPPPPLFLAPSSSPVDPLPPQGPAPSGVSQVDPLLGIVPVEVAVDSGAARGTASGGVEPGGAEPGGAESEGAGCGGAGPRGAETGGAEPAGVESGGAEPEGVEPGGAESEGAESGGAKPGGTLSLGGPAGASPRLSSRPEPLSPQQLREWFAQRTRFRSGVARAGDSAAGDTGAGGVGATRLGGAGATTGAGGVGDAAATGPRGARTRGTGAAGTGAGAGDTGGVDPGAGGVGVGGAFLGLMSSTGLPPPLLCPPPDQSQPPLQPASPVPDPSPYTEQTGGLTERREPASRLVSPVRTARRVPRRRPPPVSGTHAMALRLSSVPLRIPLPPPHVSSLLDIPDLASDLARAANPTVSRLLATVFTGPSFESTAASALVVELLYFVATCPLDYATTLVAESKSVSPPSVGGECALGTDESSSCEAEIYAGAMAEQELRWLTYLLTDLGEQPRSPPVLYVDNKAMIALCQEHKLEHRTKHIALRYFLAREFQQRGQLRLAYVASRTNTADIFTKAL
ncbi:unnamed protein product [Closterium sp. NIES-53]